MDSLPAAKAHFNDLFFEKSGGNVFGKTPYVKVCRASSFDFIFF